MFHKYNTISNSPVNIVNQFFSETLQKICLSCHEVEAIIVLENVMNTGTKQGGGVATPTEFCKGRFKPPDSEIIIF